MKKLEEPISDYNLFRIKHAEYLGGLKVRLKFSDGETTEIDFKDFITNSNNPSIKKYQDPSIFQRFKIINGNLNWNDFDMIFPLHDLRNGNL